MRYYSSSKSLEISLGLSILLHIFLFVYIQSPKPFKKVEPSPISVEYLSIPEKIGETNIKKGKTGASAVNEASVSDKSITVPESVERAVEEGPQEAKVSPVPHPIEVPKTPSYPGLKELTPSLDELTNIGKEKAEGGEGGEGGMDEETIVLGQPSLDFEGYARGVASKIEGVWRYPEDARRATLEGKGLISFTIKRNGDLVDVKLLISTGYPVLDRAIIEAIKKAAPFNPFQENMPQKRVNIVATFEYHLVSPGYIWGP